MGRLWVSRRLSGTERCLCRAAECGRDLAQPGRDLHRGGTGVPGSTDPSMSRSTDTTRIVSIRSIAIASERTAHILRRP